jgi:hypothetical protein
MAHHILALARAYVRRHPEEFKEFSNEKAVSVAFYRHTMREGVNLNEPGLAELAESESKTPAVKKQIAEGLGLARVVKWARAYVKKYPDQFKGLESEEAVAEALKRYCRVGQ